MEDFENLRVFGFGALGGCLVELVRWWKLRDAAEFPVYTRRFGYWAITLLMIGAGGLTATLYGLDPSNVAALVNIGASTPAILGALASKAEAPSATAPDSPGLGEKSFKGSRAREIAYAELLRRFI